MTDSPILLTGDEAAARLRICTRTLRRLRQRGEINYVAITDSRFYYTAEDCDAYLEARRRRDTPPPSTKNVSVRRISSHAGGRPESGFMAMREARKAAMKRK